MKINNHIILDYELQEAYRITNGSPSNANTDVNCDYGEIQIGTTKIEWSEAKCRIAMMLGMYFLANY